MAAIHPTTASNSVVRPPQAAPGRRRSVFASGLALTVQYTSQWAFHLSWVLIVATHVGVILAYKHEAYINAYILLGSRSEMALQLLGLGASIRTDIGNALVSTNYVLMAWHIYGAAQAVAASLINRRLVFRIQWKSLFAKLRGSKQQPPPPQEGGGHRVSSVASIAKPQPSVVRQTLRRLWQMYRSIGARGKHFDRAFDVREAVEIISQTVQAYSISCLITNNSVLHFVALVLVCNCWSTPVLRLLFRDEEGKKRLLCLAVDAVFDFCCALAIPFLTFALWDLQVDTIDFFDPVWLIRSSTLLRYNLVNTWSGVFTTRLPALGLVMTLETMKTLLQPSKRKAPVTHTSKPTDTKQPSTAATPATGPPLNTVPPLRVSRWSKLIDLVFFIYGLVILVLHTKAMSEPAIDNKPWSNCSLQLRPWGRDKAQCAVVDIDCQRLGIDGTATELAAQVSAFDTSVMASITFANCPSFEMPPEIQQLHRLLHLAVYNSTLRHWEADAAVTATNHPTLTGVSLVEVTNLTHGIPPGLLSLDFPQSLCVVQIVGGDMETFVATEEAAAIVTKHWPQTMFVVTIEQTRLREFPTAILSKTITQMISLSSNNLTSVPDRVLFSTRPALLVLMGGNPITALPEVATSSDSSRSNRVFLRVPNTLIQSVPPWLEEVYSSSPIPILTATGSPICTNTTTPAPSYIDCVTLKPSSYFPLDAYAQLRRQRATILTE